MPQGDRHRVRASDRRPTAETRGERERKREKEREEML
tara:strand:+ start:306 stop:416 length:111 start_codon:yes stop_codon:yes gene_type:complete